MSDLKSIKRIPSMPSRPPIINWGLEYLSRPLPERLRYAEDLASTMNNAADILQKERNNLLVRIREQEAMITHQGEIYRRQGELMHSRLAAEGVERQKLYEQIVALTKERDALKAARGD